MRVFAAVFADAFAAFALLEDLAASAAIFCAAIGLYIAGAALLAVAVVTSSTGIVDPFYSEVERGERERRVSYSFSYAAAGLAVIALGVLVEIF